jgi:hypothetical protein
LWHITQNPDKTPVDSIVFLSKLACNMTPGAFLTIAIITTRGSMIEARVWLWIEGGALSQI